MVNGIIGNTLTTPISVPKKVSQLENDAKYATAGDLSSVEAQAQEAHEVAITAINEAVLARNSASDVYSDVQVIKADYATNEHVTGVAKYLESSFEGLLYDKADKIYVSSTMTDGGNCSYRFEARHNTEIRLGQRDAIGFYFGDGEYAEDYISGLSFDSGETPTSIEYFHTGIIQWVGTDCTIDSYVNDEGVTIPVSIFQPSPNTHYEVVFYFNGVQFIGLVNGYKPVAENEPFYADEVV